MIRLIWAMDENWLIGNGNVLPWHYPSDLKHFKEQTKDTHVLMGDLTYQSLKGYYQNKPLPFRKISVANLVPTHYQDATCVQDVKAFLKEAKEDIFVIGGKTIYALALPFADQLWITYVLNHHEGDVYFPKFDLSEFSLIQKRLEPGLIFATYERRKAS